MPTPPPEKTRQAVARIRYFYEEGRESLERHPERVPHKGLDAEAGRYRLSRPWMTMARVFADRQRGYTQWQLEQLCRQCERHDAAPGLTHIARLLSVPKEQRKKIQQRMIEERWSVRRLEREICRSFGPRAKGGKRPNIGDDDLTAAAELLRACQRWERFLEQLEEDHQDDVYDLGADIRRTARKLLKSTVTIKKAVTERLDGERTVSSSDKR